MSLLQRIRERLAQVGRCETCGRLRWDLEEDDTVTDYPEAHDSVWLRQCQPCWDGETS